MKLTFPHMGNAYIAIKVLLDTLGLAYYMPPLCSRQTMELGMLHSPEFMCLPFKTVIGDFIQGLEHGADVILFGGGCGQCRLSYYGDLQQEILRSLGYKFDYIHLDLSRITYRELQKKLSPLVSGKSRLKIADALTKAVYTVFAADSLYRAAGRKRCREQKSGATDGVMLDFERKIANTFGFKNIKKAVSDARLALEKIPADPLARPIRIALIGEIFIASDPFTNLEIERKLGNLGVEVYNFMGVGVWIKHHCLRWLLPVKPKEKAVKAAREFIRTDDVGGHGIYTVGNAVLSAKEGFDGIIQIYPFTCMPEIIAQCAFGEFQDKYAVPVMTLILDEMTGEAGYMTRLEAFTDMLKMRREQKENEEQKRRLPFLKKKNPFGFSQ